MVCRDGSVRIPRELLRQRSPHFREAIDEQDQPEGDETISVEEVELTTLEWFHRWCLNENPSIPDDITPTALLDLGIFATKCQVFALQHHVADKFHEMLCVKTGQDRWVLRADIVARVYRQCPPSSCLRRVFGKALKSLPPQQVLDEWSEWSIGDEAFLDLAKAMTQLAANGFFRSPPSSVNGPCVFHDHRLQNLRPGGTEGGFGGLFPADCPFRNIECFPDPIVTSEKSAVEDQEAVTAPEKIAAEEAMNADEVPTASASGVVEEGWSDEPATEEAAPSCDAPAAEETAASCYEAAIAPEGGAVAADETSEVYGEPRAEPVPLCDETAAADAGPGECIVDWGASKKSRKEKKKKNKAPLCWDDEPPVEEAALPPGPVEEQFEWVGEVRSKSAA